MHAPVGRMRRLLNRYFIPENTKASVERHRAIGSPLIRKLVMQTVGRSERRTPHYRLPRGSQLEAITDFAMRQTVFNESVHSASFVVNCGFVTLNVYTGGNVGLYVNTAAAALDISLVALQRYNRARCIESANALMRRGTSFNRWYRSSSGIDYRAQEQYQDQLTAEQKYMSDDKVDTVMPQTRTRDELIADEMVPTADE